MITSNTVYILLIMWLLIMWVQVPGTNGEIRWTLLQLWPTDVLDRTVKVKHCVINIIFRIVKLMWHALIEIEPKEQNAFTMMYSLGVVTLRAICPYFYFHAFPPLPTPYLLDKDFDLLFQLLLIWPGSKLLILARVKTLLPLRACGSSFSLVARNRH